MTAQETALITGASSGIGLHLAHEFARHGHPLVLVAPDLAEITRIGEEIARTHSIHVDPIEADLEDEGAPERLFARLEEALLSVDILVNNAGQGQRGLFWEIPLERHLAIMQLNMAAVVRLTWLFLPGMIRRGSGRILNTASIAGFEPGPSVAVYHATKAFVLSLSEALSVETEDSGVTVTALCPGATDTDFFLKADMENTRAFQQGNLMAPQDVARAGYEALMKGDRLIIPGVSNKALIFARRMLSETALAHLSEKQYEEVASEDRRRRRGERESAASE